MLSTEQFLQGNVPLRHLLNEHTCCRRRSAQANQRYVLINWFLYILLMLPKYNKYIYLTWKTINMIKMAKNKLNLQKKIEQLWFPKPWGMVFLMAHWEDSVSLHFSNGL